MQSTTPTTDCHEAFPGSVRSTSANSCRSCGGNLEAPVERPSLERVRHLQADQEAAEGRVEMYRRMGELAMEYDNAEEVERCRRRLDEWQTEADRCAEDVLEALQGRYPM